MQGSSYDYGTWRLVVLHILILGAFVVGFLRPKGKHQWRSLGVFSAFIVALFTEMYGFPLTIYLLTSLFGGRVGLANPFSHVNGHLLGTLLGLPDWGKMLICTVGGFVMVLGLVIMARGWRQIHQAQGQFVTDGAYAYVRHPQYAGLFLMTGGLLIQWPTLITLVMFPILVFAYRKLAFREEAEIETQFGDAYRQYRGQTPAFVPRFHRRQKVVLEKGVSDA